jgi:hypothetical protein
MNDPGPTSRSDVSELDWSTVVRRFELARNWWVHTSGPAGPHAVPIWGVVLDETLIFYGDPATVRSRNLAGDPRLVMTLEDGERPLIVHGVAHRRGRAALRRELITAYREKYRGEHDAEYLLDTDYAAQAHAYEVEPTKALAWEVTALDDWQIRRWSR